MPSGDSAALQVILKYADSGGTTGNLYWAFFVCWSVHLYLWKDGFHLRIPKSAIWQHTLLLGVYSTVLVREQDSSTLPLWLIVMNGHIYYFGGEKGKQEFRNQTEMFVQTL